MSRTYKPTVKFTPANMAEALAARMAQLRAPARSGK